MLVMQVRDYRLVQDSRNYGPRAKSGPRSHFTRPAEAFRQ